MFWSKSCGLQYVTNINGMRSNSIALFNFNSERQVFSVHPRKTIPQFASNFSWFSGCMLTINHSNSVRRIGPVE
jgi:hypothetical protein